MEKETLSLNRSEPCCMRTTHTLSSVSPSLFALFACRRPKTLYHVSDASTTAAALCLPGPPPSRNAIFIYIISQDSISIRFSLASCKSVSIVYRYCKKHLRHLATDISRRERKNVRCLPIPNVQTPLHAHPASLQLFICVKSRTPRLLHSPAK